MTYEEIHGMFPSKTNSNIAFLFGDINVATQSDEHTSLPPHTRGDPKDVGESDTPADCSPHTRGVVLSIIMETLL